MCDALTVQQNLANVEEKIQAACQKSNRNRHDVNIIAVTKYVDEKRTKEALDAGIIHIGENRVEGGVEKREAFQTRGIWHFIGSIQTKKVKKMIGKFDFLHSLDRESLAEEIEKRSNGRLLHCFVQVNISQEQSKSGLNEKQVIPFIKLLEKYPSIRVVGLMTMAPFVDDPEETRPIFRRLRELKESVQALQLPYAPCDELSMGMSNDFEVAIEEGATFVRIGTLLVGSKQKDR